MSRIAFGAECSTNSRGLCNGAIGTIGQSSSVGVSASSTIDTIQCCVHVSPRFALETVRLTFALRCLSSGTRFACGLFGLVGVIVFRAFCAAWLPLFRLIQPSVAGQAEGGTVFRLVFPAAAVVALVLTRLCLVTSCLAGHAIGFAGDCVYYGSFASRASVAKCRA